MNKEIEFTIEIEKLKIFLEELSIFMTTSMKMMQNIHGILL